MVVASWFLRLLPWDDCAWVGRGPFAPPLTPHNFLLLEMMLESGATHSEMRF